MGIMIKALEIPLEQIVIFKSYQRAIFVTIALHFKDKLSL